MGNKRKNGASNTDNATQLHFDKKEDAMVEAEKLAGQIRHLAGNAKASFERCDGFLTFLKAFPKTAGDICFRCNQIDLTIGHCELAVEQCKGFSEAVVEAMSELARIEEIEQKLRALKEEWGIVDGLTSATESEREPEFEEPEGDADNM